MLFPDEAPNYCKFFTGLVEKGYYDGTYVSMVQDGVYFIGGTKQADGQTTSDTDTTTIGAEYSKNLWPLKGALCAYTQEQGHLFSKKKVSNSYLLFVDNYDLTKEEQAELDSKLADSNNIPEDITDAFEKYGGVLNFSQQYTVFGQVYDGLDIYDEICGTDVADSETLKPREDIQFTKVYMSTYGENKNSNAFAGSADSSEVSESAVDSADTSSEM